MLVPGALVGNRIEPGSGGPGVKLCVAALGILFALAAAPGSVDPVPEARPQITQFDYRIEGEELLVSFDLSGTLSAERLERLHVGLPIEFRHRIEVLSRRSLPLWPARVVARVRVEVRVEFDSLNRRYRLRRSVTHRRRGPGEDSTEVTEETTDSIENVQTFMSSMRDLPLLDRFQDAPDRLKVRLESSLGRRYLMFLIPTAVKVSAEKRIGK